VAVPGRHPRGGRVVGPPLGRDSDSKDAADRPFDSAASPSATRLRSGRAVSSPLSIHLAEDPAERELLAKGDGAWAELLRERGLPVRAGEAISPTQLAARAGLLGPRTLAVHCVDVDGTDIAILAKSGATAVLCPRSNRYLGLPAAPASALDAAGVKLALGTDSLASSPSLSVLEEAAAVALPPERALRAATRGGALALGLPHRGAIVPGARPGLVALDVVVGRRRPEAALLEQPRARLVWVNP
jgi:cytosine/adenosine deaminase-related metal-dependent hydrolase